MLHITRNVSLHGDNSVEKKREIKEYFNKTYESYEALFACMACDASYFQRADYLRHPLIFYYGHTACFYINKLILGNYLDKRVDAQLESIFAVGVDEMSWDDLDERNYEWPSVAQTKEYRKKVQQAVNNLIDDLELTLPITWESPFWAILMGIEHERIHLETSSVLIRQLPLQYVTPSAQFPICSDDYTPPANRLLEVKGSQVAIGKGFDDDFYGWDNEYGMHTTQIPDFQASKYLVSNAEFLDFVDDNGYEKDEYWEQEGLQWRNYSKAKHPTFWIKTQEGFNFRTMTQEITLPLSWPVEVNYHEAKAFCNYKSKKEGLNLRLPSEDEWYALVAFCEVEDEQQWGNKAPANINLEHYASSVPVDSFEFNGFYDVIGNVWQWSQTPIYPFEGFKVHPLYDDFTMPTFDNEHNIIKGGSWISTGNETQLSSRYAFRRHFFQHAGFRYVSSSYKESIDANVYESDESVAMYANMSWGKEYFGVKNFKAACAQIALEHATNFDKALDIGCALGRGTFELAKSFAKVVGVDYTARFIQNAQRMKEDKRLNFWVKDEGEIKRFYEVHLRDFDLQHCAGKVEFWQGDACNLKPVFNGYDLVFATNLIDRLYDPRKFLTEITQRVNKDGIVLLASPYSWDESYTPRQNWLGGFKKDGENYTTFDGIEQILQEKFELITKEDVAFVIQESSRKFQHSISEVSVWKKR